MKTWPRTALKCPEAAWLPRAYPGAAYPEPSAEAGVVGWECPRLKKLQQQRQLHRGPANDNRAEGRPAPPIPERLQHLFPKQTHSGARTERRGPLAHTHSPARSPGCPVQGPRQRLLWARVVMALQPLPVPSVGRRMQSQASLSLCPLGWKKQV